MLWSPFWITDTTRVFCKDSNITATHKNNPCVLTFRASLRRAVPELDSRGRQRRIRRSDDGSNGLVSSMGFIFLPVLVKVTSHTVALTHTGFAPTRPSGNQSSYGHGGQQMSSGYSSGYSNQSSMGGYGDYSECQLCFTHTLTSSSINTNKASCSISWFFSTQAYRWKTWKVMEIINLHVVEYVNMYNCEFLENIQNEILYNLLVVCYIGYSTELMKRTECILTSILHRKGYIMSTALMSSIRTSVSSEAHRH